MGSLNKVLLAVNLLLACALVGLERRSLPFTSQLHQDLKTFPERTEKAPGRTLKRRPYSDLEPAGDWRQWIDQLRGAGVPVPVLARLVEAGFDDRWIKQQGQAEVSYRKGEMDIDDLSALAIQHDRERENELRAAIGEEAFKNLDLGNVLQAVPLRGITLTAAESNSVYDVEKKLERVSREANELKLKGHIDQAECDQRLQTAQAGHDQQLKAILGEERYAAMYPPPPVVSEGALLNSHPDRAVPADIPFDALIDIQSRWNETHSDTEQRLQKVREQVANCEAELQQINEAWETEFQRVLGTNAYSAMQKENDRNYREMKRYADQWSLDSTAIDYVYRTIQYYEKNTADYQRRARALEAGGEDVDWDGVQRNIRDFGTQMQQSLQTHLGQERFDRLKCNNLLPFARKVPSVAN